MFNQKNYDKSQKPHDDYYSYHCYGVRVELYLPDCNWKPDDALLEAYIPGIQPLMPKKEKDTLHKNLDSFFWQLAHPILTLKIIIQYQNIPENSEKFINSSYLKTFYDKEKYEKKVQVYIAPNNQSMINVWKNDLPHFIYALLRQQWLESDIFPVHSLCAGANLIVGHSGVGKTTLASELLKNRYPVYSLDKSLLLFNHNKTKDLKLVLVDGTHVLSLRNNADSTETLLHLYLDKDNGVDMHLNIKTQNAERTIVEIQNNFEYNDIKDINCIYLLNINDGPLKVEPLSNISALHTLYPYFLDKIKENIILGGGEIFFSGKISEKTEFHLIQKLKKMVECIPVFTLWGSAVHCSQFLIDKKSHLLSHSINN